MSRRFPVRLHLELLEDRSLPSVNPLLGVPGLDFPSSNSTLNNGAAPPDPILAAGPNHIVEAVNTDLAIYNKVTGAKVFQQDLFDFFAPVQPGSNFLSDPTVSFDEQLGTNGRFVVAVLEITDPFFFSDSYMLYAVSDSADPTVDTNGDGRAFSEMHRFQVEDTGSGLFGSFLDFPRFGWNADAEVFTGNMFALNFFTGTFDFTGVQVISLDKSTLADANPNTFNYYRIFGSDVHATLAPATMHGSKPGDPMWMVEEATDDVFNRNQLRVLKFTNILSNSPTVDQFLVNVAAYTADPNAGTPTATQPGGGLIQTNDGRILNAEWRDNRLLASQVVGLPGDSDAHARWYELSTAGATPTLVSQETLDPGQGTNTYFPAVGIAPNGDVGMSYIESSPTEFMSMYVTGRTALETTMEPAVLVKAGEATYTGLMGVETSPFRAGDFSGLSIDPVDGTFWAVNEYAALFDPQPAANWATWISHFTLSAPPPVHDVAVTSVGASPNPVLRGSNVTVTVGVANQGTVSETFIVSVQESPDGTNLGSQTVTLAAGASTTLTFTWATNGATTVGAHTITATAAAVAGETDTADNSGQTAVTVNSNSNPNDMYVWDIFFTSRVRGNKHDERISVTIRRDSDADGLVESTDALVSRANVTITLTGPSGGTFTGTTNTSGVFQTGWILNLPNGTYLAEVTAVSHVTFSYSGLLDPTSNDSDLNGNGLPDQQHSIPHEPLPTRSPVASLIALFRETYAPALPALFHPLEQAIDSGPVDRTSPAISVVRDTLTTARDASFALVHQYGAGANLADHFAVFCSFVQDENPFREIV